ncbi:hypothetical protein CK203_097025 [Vitis vinifera]|uniref:Uncharacterized protein n=1 Tax=Vitis vinifera TaxID=29760 RepID=A0A438CG16_VITVI|nr:hypothetical protein CK203_097025 [Vitis vinifera]
MLLASDNMPRLSLSLNLYINSSPPGSTPLIDHFSLTLNSGERYGKPFTVALSEAGVVHYIAAPSAA